MEIALRAFVVAGLVVAAGCRESPASSAAQAATSAPVSRAAPSAAPPVTPAHAPGARSVAAQNPAGWPPIEFEPWQLDFGLLPPGGAGEGSVKIHNVGAAPLKIGKSVTSCGCTKATELRGTVIEPGSYAVFDVEMEMKSGLGPKKEGLRIKFDGFQPLAQYFFIAEVSLPVRALPPYLDAPSGTTSGEFDLYSLDGRPFSVLAAGGRVPVFVGFDAERDAPRATYRLRWDLSNEIARNAVPWYWVIETDREDSPVVDLRVRHDSTKLPEPKGAPWVKRDQRIVVGAITGREPFEIETKVEYGEGRQPDPATARVASASSAFGVELIQARAEGQYLVYGVRVTPRNPAPGLLYGEFTIAASGHDGRVIVIASVRP